MRRVIAAFFAVSVFAQSAWCVVYGKDDRQDLYDVSDALFLRLADSTVGLFRASDVGAGSSYVSISTKEVGPTSEFCSGERFYHQPTAAFCSGALVGSDLILTAGHCIKDLSECHSTRFVFGFAIRSPGDSPAQVKAEDVYGCAAIISRDTAGGQDHALIRLDRKVKNHSPLPINRTGLPEVGTPLVMIGHPFGLPMKVTAGATVRRLWNRSLQSDLDAFIGNSGSPVFNAKTGVIEGVQYRGNFSNGIYHPGANDYNSGCFTAGTIADWAGPKGNGPLDPDLAMGTSFIANLIPKF